MKYFILLIIFIITLLCKCSNGQDEKPQSEVEKAFCDLSKTIKIAWEDMQKITFKEDHQLAETGRGKKMSKMAIPLMFGFKMAGVVIAALTALKILLLQSLVMSKFALVGAMLLAVKVIFDHMHHHLYKVTDINHVNYGHSYPAHLLGVESSPYEAYSDPGNIGYAYYTPTDETSADDLHNQYVSGLLHTAQAKNSSRSATDRFYSVGTKRPNSKVVSLKTTIVRKTTNAD